MRRNREEQNKYKAKTPKKVPPKPSDTKYKEGNLESPHGWLDLKGIFYPCKYGDHDWMAEHEHMKPGEYEKEQCNVNRKNHWFITPTQLLESKGWIKIQKKLFCIPDDVGIEDEWFVTNEQFRFINDYLAFNGVDCIGSMNLRIK